MNNYDEKIINIKETQKQLLEFAKNKINEKSDVFNDNVKDVIEVLDYDSKMVKKYEAVVEAQKLIIELTNQIKNSTSVEEIIEIRKKLNYYINKIKREIKNRNIDSYEYNKYVLNATNLRKGISEYIRYLKREDKIKEIEYLNNKDSLNEEESIRLKKLLKNEISYGRRNLNKCNVNEENEVVKPIEKKEEDSSRKFRYRYIKNEYVDGDKSEKEVLIGRYFKDSGYTYKKKQEPAKTKEVKKVDQKLKTDESQEERIIIEKQPIQKTPNNNIGGNKSYDSLYDFLDDQVNSFAERYRVLRQERYTRSVIGNIRVFVDNLDIIRCNKMKTRNMIRDLAIYNKPELDGYIRYLRSESSIMKSIKKAIVGSPFKDVEQYYDAEHKRCITWIMEYFKQNNIECTYNRNA